MVIGDLIVLKLFQCRFLHYVTDEYVSVGCMVINSILKLRHLGQSTVFSLPNTPTIADLDSDGETEGTLLEQIIVNNAA